MPVLVRNRENGPTVFSIPEKNIQHEWYGAGDPGGQDVQYVADDLLTNVQFSKMVRQGIFEIVQEADSQESLDKQASAYSDRTSAAAKAAVASIDQQVNNDLVQAPCIGPSNRGQGECGEPVAVKEKEVKNGDRPILCSRHSSLAPQYARVETGTMIESGDSLVAETKWVRSQMTPRENKSQ